MHHRPLIEIARQDGPCPWAAKWAKASPSMPESEITSAERRNATDVCRNLCGARKLFPEFSNEEKIAAERVFAQPSSKNFCINVTAAFAQGSFDRVGLGNCATGILKIH